MTRRSAQVSRKRTQAITQRLLVYQDMVEALEGCLLWVTADGIVGFANRRASELLGTERPLEGHSFLMLADAQSQSDLAQALRAVVAGELVRDLDTRHQLSDGAHTFRWTLKSLRSAGIRPQADSLPCVRGRSSMMVLALGLDVTHRLEQEQRSAENDAMAVMGTLTTGLAHEIRNPLNAAKLQLELLLSRAKRAGDERLQTQLGEPAALVRTAIGRLSLMLDEFLHVARPREPVRQPCLVAELFDQVLAVKRPTIEGAGIELRSYVREAGLEARCDEAKIKQVLINLIRNSVDALGARGHGTIELHGERRAAGGVSISVLDDGPGLAGNMRGEAAFAHFSTTKPAGTGLGLSIARKLVSQHGGTIQLYARPGVGTAACFWISD